MLAVSADVYRPAAIQQLKLVAEQAGIDFYPTQGGDKPTAIAASSLDFARKHYYDVVLFDTAGRLAIDEAMMKEVAELHAALQPVETLFVVDAMLGQDAVEHGTCLQRSPAADRDHPHQVGRRLARGRGAFSSSCHRQATQIRWCRREIDWS